MGERERPALADAASTRLTVRERLLAWIELARLSNAPTIVGNAFCGVVLASTAVERPFPWLAFTVAASGSVLIYAAGMILNDVVDAATDARERPSRPIPSGRIARSHALALVIVLLLVGLAVFATCNTYALLCAAVLCACVVAYNLLHAGFAISILFLGACRGLLYFAAFAAAANTAPFRDPVVLAVGGSVALYTVVFSILARYEVAPGSRPQWMVSLPWLLVIATAPIALFGRVAFTTGFLLAACLATAALLWNADPPRPVKAVMLWIAALCLIDAMIIDMFADWRYTLIPFACFALTLLFQRRILGS